MSGSAYGCVELGDCPSTGGIGNFRGGIMADLY